MFTMHSDMLGECVFVFACMYGAVFDTVMSVASMLEGIFRSLNNLLEKLHHSEFYYLTPSRDTFLSLGRYLPPLGLLLAPMILEVSLF